MRKLVVLMLVFGFGLAMAGAEQWIGVNHVHNYTIQNPEPGIFPDAPNVFRPAVDTFKYDDNMPANAWAYSQGGSGWGVKFISPSDNVTLAGALVHFYDGWPSPGGTNALVKVYADDGTHGAPGTEIWASDTVTITMGQWNFIPIDEPIFGSNYYIFYVQVDSYPMCPGMSLDAFSNAPSHRMWTYTATDGFAEDQRVGEWLIRAVLDWSPQEHNAAPLYFATNMPMDTVPDINFYVRAMIKNLGTEDLLAGTPVRLHITGPNAYTYDDTMNTTVDLGQGQTQQMNFSPAWRIPSTTGAYQVQVWTEAADEQWPADDTIRFDLSVAEWIQYGDYTAGYWIYWGGPQRATQFDPADFELTYPVGVTRVRTQFYLHPDFPWPDSSFYFKIYGDDGSTMLYESDILEAPAGGPGPVISHDLDSMLIFPSGGFYVAVDPVSSTSHPSSFADDESDGHSFVGSPGAWQPPRDIGEYLISASACGNVGIGEGGPSVTEPTLSVVSYPNPVSDMVTVRWQVPSRQQVSVNLYDATGRLARNLYSASDGLEGSVTLDARSLAAGIYLVRLETRDGAATRKLVLE